jgi:hypothetical protein
MDDTCYNMIGVDIEFNDFWSKKLTGGFVIFK